MSLELAAFAKDLGLPERDPETDGFDLADAAREAGRLALNHSRAATPDERTAAQEKDDWIAIGGLGADLGNMAGEGALRPAAGGVRGRVRTLLPGLRLPVLTGPMARGGG